jgi:glucose/mannose transport system substrate-binding protein
MKQGLKLKIVFSLCVALPAQPLLAYEKSVEVAHWWITGGSAAALDVLKEATARRGLIWKDSALLNGGSGGDEQRRSLAARIAARNYPDAAQISGTKVQDYAKGGHLGNLNDIAAAEGWEKALPPSIVKSLKYNAKWVGVPVTVHRANWVWANKRIFDELKLDPPKSFHEMVIIAEKIRKAGYIPLAHGGQPWQDALLFDSAVLSAGGSSFYRRALIDLNPEALGSKTMEKAFAQMLHLRGMVDPHYIGREWNFATDMVINGAAAMQIMGDWAKGEFVQKGKKPGEDFICFPYPGTAGSFIYVADMFAIFNVQKERTAAQHAFASTVMNKKSQADFARIKGSIPARTDVQMDNFDSCSKTSAADLKQAAKNDTLVPRFESEISDEARTAIFAIASNTFQSTISPQQAVKDLASVGRQARSK